MTGKTILHYKILKKLGEGGMGVVYLAEDTKLKRKVAIKFLPHQISANEEERKRFEIEAQAAAALNHPNVATIYAIEEFENQMFIVMEYIDGKELKHVVETGYAPSLSIDNVINYAIQIAEGLEAAHKKGIVHRDIKSQNIMITHDGKVKIMDFGLAKVGKGKQLTQIGSTVGTIAYMSPEQTRGDETDNRTDIWSYGVVLYEMITGKMPFKGDYDQAIIYSILNEEPEPVAEIEDGLKYILSKSLAKNPDDRYQTAGEIAEELYKISKGESTKKVVKQSKLPWMTTVAILIFIAAAIYIFKLSNNVNEPEVLKTIAVLPFLDLSPKNDQEYFSEGLSEELLNVLAQNPHLQVTSRTSSFSFKGKEVDIKTIASKLNVKHILEGSIRKAGNSLRITAQLIDVDTDTHLWSKIYNGTLANIFSLQDSISSSVAEALNITLLGEKDKSSRHLTDPDAYSAYLLGKHFLSLRGKNNYEKAVDYFHQAIEIDSNYAPTWVALSKAHTNLADNGYLPVDENYDLARQEIIKALKLDPKLADAHSQMGWIKRAHDWDWTGADESYSRALELEPGNASIVTNAAVLSATLGRLDKAIELTRRSVKLNPLSTARYNNLGYTTLYAGLFEESEMAFKKTLELNPQYPGGHTQVGLVYFRKQKFDKALKEMQRETDPFWRSFGLALVYYSLGNKQVADEQLKEIIELYQSNSAYQIAEIYAYRGENDNAFIWLERAYKQKDSGLSEMKSDPLLYNIVKDKRYTALLTKMKLPL